MANSVHALHHRPSLCYTDAHLVPSRMVRVAQLFVVLLQEYIDVIVLAAAVVDVWLFMGVSYSVPPLVMPGLCSFLRVTRRKLHSRGTAKENNKTKNSYNQPK